jgi:hypothetical protein
VRVDAGAQRATLIHRRRAGAVRRSCGSSPGQPDRRQLGGDPGAVVGSCSRAVPTWTALAPALRKARRRRWWRCHPQRPGVLGQRGPHVRHRSAAQPAGSPARRDRPGCRCRGQRAALPRPRGRQHPPRRPPGAAETIRTTSAELDVERHPHRELADDLVTMRAAWNGSAGVEDPEPPRVVDGEVELDAGDTRERWPRRRVMSAYSARVAPATETTWMRTPCCASHGSSVIRNRSTPGFCRRCGVHQPGGASPRSAGRPPRRGSMVSVRVTKPPSPASSPYGASSRPVPPHPLAIMTGSAASRGSQQPPLDAVAAEDRTLGAGTHAVARRRPRRSRARCTRGTGRCRRAAGSRARPGSRRRGPRRQPATAWSVAAGPAA